MVCATRPSWSGLMRWRRRVGTSCARTPWWSWRCRLVCVCVFACLFVCLGASAGTPLSFLFIWKRHARPWLHCLPSESRELSSPVWLKWSDRANESLELLVAQRDRHFISHTRQKIQQNPPHIKPSFFYHFVFLLLFPEKPFQSPLQFPPISVTPPPPPCVFSHVTHCLLYLQQGPRCCTCGTYACCDNVTQITL